jgi:hypothetical protein
MTDDKLKKLPLALRGRFVLVLVVVLVLESRRAE